MIDLIKKHFSCDLICHKIDYYYHNYITMSDIQNGIKNCKTTATDGYQGLLKLLCNDSINLVKLPKCKLEDVVGDVYFSDQPLICRANDYYPKFIIPAYAMVMNHGLANPIEKDIMVTQYMLIRRYYCRLYRAHFQEKFRIENYQYLIK